MKIKLLKSVGLPIFLGAGMSHGVAIRIDYSLDTNNFFGASGSDQRNALEAARDFYQSNIDQSFDAIIPGAVYNPGTAAEFSNTWTANFSHPGSGISHEIVDMSLSANEIVIYAGGRDLGGSTVGRAGRGGFSSDGITAFVNSVSRGSSSSKYALWGGRCLL